MNYGQLTRFGLSEPEARVYLAALELGEATVERIAKKSLQNRTSIYHTLGLLQRRSLITKAKRGKRTVYIAEDPVALHKTLQEDVEMLHALLPQLRARANAVDKKPKLYFYEGLDGLRTAANDSLQHGDHEIQFWFSNTEATEKYNTYWFNTYVPERLSKRIATRGIGPVSATANHLQERDSQELRRTRVDKRGTFLPKSEIQLYGNNRVSITSFRDLIAVVIESKDIHDTLKSIFESHWNSLEP